MLFFKLKVGVSQGWTHDKVLIMAYLDPPNSVGYVPNPNLVLPVYIRTEVIRVQDPHGVVWHIRRPRPPSIIAGAQLVLQCDRDLLAR